MIRSEICEAGTAFDSAAPSYDEAFERSSITRHIRGIINDRMLYRFHAGDRVIDINCGTGTDAVFLAHNGIAVSAIDASPAMVDLAREKSRSEGVAGLVTVHAGTYTDPGLFVPELYDGAISNFGGLNCTPDPGTVASHVHSSLKPGGIFLASVMNKACLWEILSFSARGDIRTAARRFRSKSAPAQVGNRAVQVWYHTPRRFVTIISKWFEIETIYGLSILSPSPNSAGFAARHPRLTAKLIEVDSRVRDTYPFYALGDHFVIEGRKK